MSVIDPVTEEVEGGDVTDSAGRFHVDGLEGDGYRVEVVALGYEPAASIIVERTATLHEFDISFTLDPAKDPVPTIDSRFRRSFWDAFAFDMFDCPDADACPDYYRDGAGPLPLEERPLYVLPYPSPNIYIRTERENGEPGFSSSQIRTLRRVIPRAIADLTGEPFTGQITEGSADRDQDGWITVVAVRVADDPEVWGRNDDDSILCGRARIGWTNGRIRLNLDGVRSTPTRRYCWLDSIIRHEIGHAMGFFHVRSESHVMAPFARGRDFSSRERYHGQLAYQMERYTATRMGLPTRGESATRTSGYGSVRGVRSSVAGTAVVSAAASGGGPVLSVAQWSGSRCRLHHQDIQPYALLRACGPRAG